MITLEFGKPDIVALVREMGFGGLDLSGLKLGDHIEFSMRTPFGPVELSISAIALDGTVELDIARATIDGLSIFGGVRSEAASIILHHLAPFKDKIKAWKHVNGNLRFSVPGVTIEKVTLAGGTAQVIFDV